MSGVYIEPYNPSWPLQFEVERNVLQNAIAPWITGPIEHIGSTSVPGLGAKPIIDMMAGVGSLEESKPAIAALAPYGYCYSPYKADQMHWFCKPSADVRTHHLHLIPFQSTLWFERLAFREALRRRPDLARAYERLKLELAEKFRHDRDAYTEAKTAFITAAIGHG